MRRDQHGLAADSAILTTAAHRCIEELQHVGVYDPSSLTIVLPFDLPAEIRSRTEARPTASEGDMLSLLPSPVLRAAFLHEYTHFLTTVSTGSGLRAFVLANHALAAALTLISAVAEEERGTLQIPLLRSITENLSSRSDRTRSLLAKFVLLRTTQMYFDGRMPLPEGLVRAVPPDVPRPLAIGTRRHQDVEIPGMGEAVSLSVVHVCHEGHAPRPVIMGAHVLREAIAKICELAFRGSEEPIFSVEAARGKESSHPDLVDYHVVDWLVNAALQGSPHCDWFTTAALAELSLVWDEGAYHLSQNLPPGLGAHQGLSPGEFFMDLLSVLASEPDKIPPLEDDREGFVRELAKRYPPLAGLKALTKACHKLFVDGTATATAEIPMTILGLKPPQLDTIKMQFESGLELRSEEDGRPFLYAWSVFPDLRQSLLRGPFLPVVMFRDGKGLTPPRLQKHADVHYFTNNLIMRLLGADPPYCPYLFEDGWCLRRLCADCPAGDPNPGAAVGNQCLMDSQVSRIMAVCGIKEFAV